MSLSGEVIFSQRRIYTNMQIFLKIKLNLHHKLTVKLIISSFQNNFKIMLFLLELEVMKYHRTKFPRSIGWILSFEDKWGQLYGQTKIIWNCMVWFWWKFLPDIFLVIFLVFISELLIYSTEKLNAKLKHLNTSLVEDSGTFIPEMNITVTQPFLPN